MSSLPLESTPAARAGVLSNDLIVKLNDQETEGMNFKPSC